MVRIELTPKEQKTLLQHCQAMDSSLYKRIQNAPNGIIHLLKEDCFYLKNLIQETFETVKKPKTQTILGTIFNKLASGTNSSSFAEAIHGIDFDNIEDLNAHLKGIMTDRNNTPDPEMGNLSPNQVSKLIRSSWDSDQFPLKFEKELKYPDVQDSKFFINTTIFLKTLIEMDKEPTATAKGNLNRKIVKILFDRLDLEESYKDDILEYNKVINEEDVFLLHIIRIVCECAGLIHRRKNKFLMFKKHQALLSKERAGELYFLLFNSYFRKFNISYPDRLPELDSVQHTIAYSIFRLKEIADNFINLEGITEQILLPAVVDEVRAALSKYVFIEWLIASRIINPLRDLGLLECNYTGKDMDMELRQLKKTKLFDKFITVQW